MTYAEALAIANKATSEFRTIQRDYRNGAIGDAEYLAGRKAFEESQKAFDAARGEVA